MGNLDWNRIPSLVALRAFECTARLQSMSAAARALNVTPAAIAQNVRALEEQLSTELIYRDGRGIKVTAKGVRLAQTLSDAFQLIDKGVSEAVMGDEGQPLKVTLPPSFARSWLTPRLGSFWAEHEDIPLTLHATNEVVDLREENIAVGIRFGTGDWQDVASRFLKETSDLIVGTPTLIGGAQKLCVNELQNYPWVLVQDFADDIQLLRALGLDTSNLNIRTFPNGELCLAAALEGYGLTITSDVVAEPEISAGKLSAVYQIDKEGLGYHVVTLPGPQRLEVKKFITWLISQVGSEVKR